MPVEPVPSRLEPHFMPRIWGRRRLDPLFSDRGEFPEAIGEAWLTGRDSLLADGPFVGQTLGEAWRAMPSEWAGWCLRSMEEFPLLVKFIFPGEKLSIQVHPDDEYARVHEAAAGGRGKVEMWYAIAAEPGGEVLLGLRPGITREDFRQAIARGDPESCLERIAVAPGDAIFVPPGTVHTIGPGLVLCEVQEYSDLTYRVFDYNRLTPAGRPRPLHIEKALEVIRFGNERAGKLRPVQVSRGALTKTYFIACRCFSVEKWEFAAPVAATTSGERFEVFVFLAGAGAWAGCRLPAGRYGESKRYSAGQAWFLPAGLGGYTLAPDQNTTLLRACLPELGELDQALAREGVALADRTRLLCP